MKTAGLTGAPGCGKSTALKIFEELNWVTVDADALCASLHADPASGIQDLMLRRWGSAVLNPDGTTNKKELAKIVFADQSELKWLEGVIHPLVRRRVLLKLEEAACGSKVMIDSAILYETRWDSLVGHVICVWTDEKTQMERLLARNWTMEHAKERIASQLPALEKLERADFGIINTKDLDFLREQCVRIDQIFNRM